MVSIFERRPLTLVDDTSRVLEVIARALYLNLINRSSCLGLAGPLTVLTVPMGQLTRVRDGVTELVFEAGV